MTLELNHCRQWNPDPGDAGELRFGADYCRVSLNFCLQWSPAAGDTVILDFGADPCVPPVTPEPPASHDVTINAVLPPPISTLNIGYDVNVARGILSSIMGNWERANIVGWVDVCSIFQQAETVGSGACKRWSKASTLLDANVCAAWKKTDQARWRACGSWSEAAMSRPENVVEHWQQMDHASSHASGQYKSALAMDGVNGCFGWITLNRLSRPDVCAKWNSGTWILNTRTAPATSGAPLGNGACVAWGRGTLRHGWGGYLPQIPIVPEPPEGPCYTPDSGWALLQFFEDYAPPVLPVLDFRCPGDGPLPPGGTIFVPIRGVYVMLNEARLFRVSDNTEIPVLSASASIDADSWVWSVSASVPVDAQAMVQDDGSGPVELRLIINSHEFRFLAENLRRNRTFSGKSLSISGRGMAATLDAPYADAVTRDNAAQARTAVQLMEDALTINGVPMGWTVDATEITDWLVPAGAWSHTGSHISAINAIAGTINAMVQADPTGQTIRIKPRYPLMPWEWASSATTGIVLPENVVVQEGVEWIKSPAHNAVYVSGTTQGVLGRAIVEGTAGDDYAEMVTHDLITNADAVRQRGAAILGATGRRQLVSLSMPIGGDTNLPIIQPNIFIDYGPLGIGLSRGVRVDAKRPAFRQTVDVEVYLGR